MGRNKNQEQTENQEKAQPREWRVLWTDRLANGRSVMFERVEYADTQAKAVNQALAKLRQGSPTAAVVACVHLTSD